MTHDLIIRNGTLADGSGGEPRTGDLGIDGNTITAIGEVDGSAHEEIDARGNLVTPGFVDLHTHLDAQIGWDPMLTPISWHGVTTALLGNCGVTFAPCKAEDQELLAAMMETVEDIPREAILSGLPWTWESYGDYLDTLEAHESGHQRRRPSRSLRDSLLRDGRPQRDDQPTPEKSSRLRELAGDAVESGAVGFSTNRFLGHYMPDGRHVPGTHAHHDELEAIAREWAEPAA